MNISGAAAGDILTFTTTANYTDVPSPQNYYGVGIAAATVVAAVPEPSSLALLGGGFLILVLGGRRVRV